MLKIILNRLKPEEEKISSEEQAGFRPGRSTTEQIFNLSILCERYLHHQQDLYHVFIDFKKAFDRVWHAALWTTMRLYNINTNLINAIQNHYDKATIAVCFNGSTGGWFRTTVGVRQAVCSHPPSSTYSWRESWLVHLKIIFLYSCETWTLTAEIESGNSGNETFHKSPWHFVQRPHYQRRGAKEDSESHWTLRTTLVHC